MTCKRFIAKYNDTVTPEPKHHPSLQSAMGVFRYVGTMKKKKDNEDERGPVFLSETDKAEPCLIFNWGPNNGWKGSVLIHISL